MILEQCAFIGLARYDFLVDMSHAFDDIWTGVCYNIRRPLSHSSCARCPARKRTWWAVYRGAVELPGLMSNYARNPTVSGQACDLAFKMRSWQHQLPDETPCLIRPPREYLDSRSLTGNWHRSIWSRDCQCLARAPDPPDSSG
jgi:hypothetical protein